MSWSRTACQRSWLPSNGGSSSRIAACTRSRLASARATISSGYPSSTRCSSNSSSSSTTTRPLRHADHVEVEVDSADDRAVPDRGRGHVDVDPGLRAGCVECRQPAALEVRRPGAGTKPTWSFWRARSRPGRLIGVPAGIPIHSPCSSVPSQRPGTCQWGRPPHFSISMRTGSPSANPTRRPYRSPPAGLGALRDGGDEVLVAGAGEPGDVMEDVGVEADQQPGLAAEDALLDDDLAPPPRAASWPASRRSSVRSRRGPPATTCGRCGRSRS